MSPVTLVELVALAAVAAPAVRLLVRPGIRATFPRLWLALVVAMLVLAGVSVAAAFWLPVALHVAAPVAVALAFWTGFRARPSAGRRRRLPPGSLGLLTSLEALADRRFYLDASRRFGPVFKMAQVRRPTVCVVGLDRGHQIMREHASALRSPPLPFSHEIEGGFLRYMDAETHERYGPLFRRALARPVVVAAAPVARAAARRELAELAAQCALTGEPVLPGGAFERIVFDTYLRGLVGIEPGSTGDSEFRKAYQPIERWSISKPLGAPEREGIERLRSIMRTHLDESEGANVSVLSELRRLDPSMPDSTALDNLVFTHKIAVSNTTGLLQWVVALLGRDPAWVGRLQASQRASEGDDLFGHVVSETLRLAQSEYLYRAIDEDIEVDGHRLPKGWLLRLCVWESHRDPTVFQEPESFDPERFARRRYSTDEYAPFGFGRHACNGIAVNDVVCRAVLEELVDSYTWSTIGDGPPAHDLRHWRHWRTSPDLALELEARPAAAREARHPQTERAHVD